MHSTADLGYGLVKNGNKCEDCEDNNNLTLALSCHVRRSSIGIGKFTVWPTANCRWCHWQHKSSFFELFNRILRPSLYRLIMEQLDVLASNAMLLKLTKYGSG